MTKKSNKRTQLSKVVCLGNFNSNTVYAKVSCYGKVQHKSRLAAEYILDRMNGKRSHLLEIYECKFCKFFHIGHNENKGKTKETKTV